MPRPYDVVVVVVVAVTVASSATLAYCGGERDVIQASRLLFA